MASHCSEGIDLDEYAGLGEIELFTYSMTLFLFLFLPLSLISLFLQALPNDICSKVVEVFCLCRTVFGSPCISSFLLTCLSRYPRFPLSPSWSIPPFTHPLSFSSCLLRSCLSVNIHVSFPLSLGKASALASGTAEVYAKIAADTHTHGHIIKAF